jgi:hypothetical protein
MNKKHLRFLSLAFFVLGVFFLLNSKIDITGAVIGLHGISSGFSSILGIAFIVGSIILLVVNKKLEDLLGISDREGDEDYQGLIEQLTQKSVPAKPISLISGLVEIEKDDYMRFLSDRLFDKFETKMKDAYINDYKTFLGIHNSSEKNKYLKKRVEEINRDKDRASEIKEILSRTEKKPREGLLESLAPLVDPTTHPLYQAADIITGGYRRINIDGRDYLVLPCAHGRSELPHGETYIDNNGTPGDNIGRTYFMEDGTMRLDKYSKKKLKKRK